MLAKLAAALRPNKKPSAPQRADWLFVGLGNPGRRYAETRHNIGWMVCEAYAAHRKTEFSPGKGSWFQAFARRKNSWAAIVLPTTYMNNSGEAVAAVQRLFCVPPERTVVVVDEYNFPTGKIQLKPGGSDGGHNGLASVIGTTGTRDFLRLRCGIAKNFERGELVDYVLSPFADAEHEARDTMIRRGVQALDALLLQGEQRAMSAINSGSLWRPAEQGNNDSDAKADTK